MVFYRYEDILCYGGYNTEVVKIVEEEFKIVKETPCGYWITKMNVVYTPNGKLDYTLCRWVSKTSKKRFAYPTREEAWENFKCRKYRRKQILLKALDRVNSVLDLIEKNALRYFDKNK